MASRDRSCGSCACEVSSSTDPPLTTTCAAASGGLARAGPVTVTILLSVRAASIGVGPWLLRFNCVSSSRAASEASRAASSSQSIPRASDLSVFTCYYISAVTLHPACQLTTWVPSLVAPCAPSCAEEEEVGPTSLDLCIDGLWAELSRSMLATVLLLCNEFG
jgi:hypothetical protein